MRYCLLVITWLIILAVNIFLYSSTNIWLWCILAVLSVIPIAERLKVGSWFDFRKKGKDEEEQTNKLQERVTNIGNINVQLQNEEAARAFAESMFTEPVPNELETAGELTEEHKEFITFFYNVDKALSTLRPLVEALYVTVSGELEKRAVRSKEWNKIGSEVHDMDLLSILAKLKVHTHEVFDFEDGEKKFKSLFEPVERLIRIREDVEKNDAKTPSKKEAIALVGKVFYACGFITGMFTAGMSELVAITRKRSL